MNFYPRSWERAKKPNVTWPFRQTISIALYKSTGRENEAGGRERN